MSLLTTLRHRIGGAVRSLVGASPLSNPSPDVLRAMGAGPSRAGVEVNPRSALSLSQVLACVRNLSEDVAKLPFNVHRNLQPAGREMLPTHPLYRLMNLAPNVEQDAFEVRQTITAMAVLWGNGRAEIEKDRGGRPINLWPIEPWRITVKRDARGKLYYLVDGSIRLEQEDVFDLRGFSLTGIVGEMVTFHGRDSLGVAIAAQRFAASFFGNGARTTGILKFPNKLSDKAYERVKGDWNQQYTGPDNAHGTPILEEGGEYEQTTTAPNEAQMLETRQFSVEDVCRWFRMPPHKVGHLERAQGWSTVDMANTDYVTDTLIPWFTRWEQQAKRKLISSAEPDVFCEHNADAILRGDVAARIDGMVKLRNVGAINGDEMRLAQGFSPIPDGSGKLYFIPGNMRPMNEPYTAAAPGKDDAKSDDKDPDAQRALAAMTEDTARRMLRVEIDKVRRAAKRPGFAEWLTTFYGEHRTHVATALNTVSQAFNVADFNVTAYADANHRELQAAVRGATDPAAAIEPVLLRWEREQPAAIARQIAGSQSL